MAFCASVVNLLVDLLYAVVDPRIKATFKASAARKNKKQFKLAVASTEGGNQ